MTKRKFVAATVFAFALSTMPALAVRSPADGGQEAAAPAPNPGVESSLAVTSDEARIPFFINVPAADQSTVAQRCEDEAIKSSFTADTAFCGVTIRR